MEAIQNYFSRLLLKVKIYESNGDQYESLFTKIQQYLNPDFRQVKPQGSLGDGKNDGYIKSDGIYFQVYAPENSTRTITNAISKIESDFVELKKQWSDLCLIKKWYFVMNDKYNNFPTEIHKKLLALGNVYTEVSFLPYQSIDLENDCMKLKEDEIMTIVGSVPNDEDLKIRIADESFKEAIKKINEFEIRVEKDNIPIVPDYDKKIKHNNLSKEISYWLSKSDFQFGIIEDHFRLKPENRKIIKEKLIAIYDEEMKEYNNRLKDNNDLVFVSIFNKISNELTNSARFAALCLLSYFFIRCDIFERPEKC
jgi:hypothetical protein